jgi:hypothetical protein
MYILKNAYLNIVRSIAGKKIQKPKSGFMKPEPETSSFLMIW